MLAGIRLFLELMLYFYHISESSSTGASIKAPSQKHNESCWRVFVDVTGEIGPGSSGEAGARTTRAAAIEAGDKKDTEETAAIIVAQEYTEAQKQLQTVAKTGRAVPKPHQLWLSKTAKSIFRIVAQGEEGLEQRISCGRRSLKQPAFLGAIECMATDMLLFLAILSKMKLKSKLLLMFERLVMLVVMYCS